MYITTVAILRYRHALLYHSSAHDTSIGDDKVTKNVFHHSWWALQMCFRGSLLPLIKKCSSPCAIVCVIIEYAPASAMQS